MTLSDVADELEWSPAKLGHIETGIRKWPSVMEISALLRLYGVTGGQREAILTLVRESRLRPWWTEYEDVLSSAYVGNEAGAVSVQAYAGILVPDLLQVPDYTAAVARSLGHGEHTVERMVAAYLKRQEVLDHGGHDVGRGGLDVGRSGYDVGHGSHDVGQGGHDVGHGGHAVGHGSHDVGQGGLVRYHAIVEEDALQRVSGNLELLRAQTTRIVELATGSDRVTVQLLPTSAGPHPGVAGPFSILEFDEDEAALAYVEATQGGSIVEAEESVTACKRVWSELTRIAASPQVSMGILRRMSLLT